MTFDHTVLASSLSPDEFLLTIPSTGNSEYASSYTVDGPNTVTFYFDPSIVPLGNSVENDVTIGYGPSSGLIPTDLSGTPLGGGAGYTSYFFTDNLSPTIVSSSIDGKLFSPAPATVTEVVDFSEPMNTSFIDVGLFGNYRGTNFSPTSEVWQDGPNGPNSELVLTYSNLPDDTYSLNLYSFGFYDLVGNPLLDTYTANFAVAFGTGAFPTLTPVAPLGSLIYQGTDTHVLVTSSDTDTFTINLNPGQTLSIQVTPQTGGMQPGVTLVDPLGNIVGQATYDPSTGFALLNAAPVVAGGAYSILVSDPSGATGLYSIHLDLNALIKPGTSVDTPAGALNLDSSTYILGINGDASASAWWAICPSPRDRNSATLWWSRAATWLWCRRAPVPSSSGSSAPISMASPCSTWPSPPTTRSTSSGTPTALPA